MSQDMSYWALRVRAARAAEEAGMRSYFKNIYTDFLCCADTGELKAVAAELAHYNLHSIRTPQAIEADMAAARAGGPSQFQRYEALQKELLTSRAYEEGDVFNILEKLRALYTRLYDELKESATSAK